MNLFVNSIIEWCDQSGSSNIETNKIPIVERVLYSDSEFIVTINIFTKSGLPVIRRFDELLGSFLNRDFRILKDDPYSSFLIPEDSISEKSKKYRDTAWKIIQEIISLPGLKAFDSNIRGKIISRISAETGIKKKVVYSYLKNFWKRGMTKNALLPNFKNCGGKGKTREGNDKNETKLGKPSALSVSRGERRGIRITFEIKAYFRRGLKEFYENVPKSSLRLAYQKTLEKFFKSKYQFKGDVPVPVLPDSSELPTFEQFRYYYETEYRNPIREIKTRQGEINFQLQYREILGNSTEMAFGPGSLYQIDATVVDIYLVSSFDRTKIIGRPVLYLVVDVFSRMIVGMAVLLEGPSWLGAMLALDNTVADKVEFCAEYGIEITPKQWNCHHLPEAILADRGEFESYNADNLVSSLNMVMHNAPPYRADLKAIVERLFRIFNEKLIHFEPGAVIKHRNRGERDYRLDAVLTINEFRALMIANILDHNHNRYLKSYRMDEFMIADNLERYPINLWNWGIQNRSGHRRTLLRDVVRMNLLPRREITVTAQGLHFERELYYACDPLLRDGLMMRKRGRKSPKVTVAYDPRTVDYVYLPSLDNRQVTICPLTPAAKTFLGKNLYEAQAYFNQETQLLELAQTQQIQSKAQIHAIQNHVTNSAIEKAAEALENSPDISNSQRLSGIRENRQLDKEAERAKSLWNYPQSDGNSDSEPDNLNNQLSDDKYVAPLSNANEIRGLRKQIKGGKK
jgi:putative transposase